MKIIIFSAPPDKTLEEILSLVVEKGLTPANGVDLTDWQGNYSALQREGHAPSRICCLIPTKGGASYPILVDENLTFVSKKQASKEVHFLVKKGGDNV